ncbi:MAG: gluconate 2-dehydrogenase subunit 3 family protein [Bradyrhizobiaceae bacterium]|nr:gluconate 2-dehydrogenase subunit 3 family protein [Bradyrhizobiaceae bacterium]
MRDLYPGYDVLSKRHTPSWNEATRRVIEARLALDPSAHRHFSEAQWQTLRALCDRIVPQPSGRAQVPVAAMVDLKMTEDARDGYRHADLPAMQESWRRGIGALDAEARAAHGSRFHEIPPAQQDELIAAMQHGNLKHRAWEGMPSHVFFKERVLPDIVRSYYAHPTAWSEIGWGGPASPRGYVRLQVDRRDSWEAAEARPGYEAEAYRENRRVGRR